MPRARTSVARKQNDFSLNNTRNPTRTSCRNESNNVIRLLPCWLDHPTVAQLNDPVSVSGIFFRVRDLNDGRALGVKFLKNLHNLFTLTGVKISSRLVRQDQFRAGDDCARHANELLLTAG